MDEWLERGVIQMPFQFLLERQRVLRLMQTYQDVPLSFTDACLVRLAELNPTLPVLTLDRNFPVYPRNGRERIETRMPG